MMWPYRCFIILCGSVSFVRFLLGSVNIFCSKGALRFEFSARKYKRSRERVAFVLFCFLSDLTRGCHSGQAWPGRAKQHFFKQPTLNSLTTHCVKCPDYNQLSNLRFENAFENSSKGGAALLCRIKDEIIMPWQVLESQSYSIQS